MAREFDTANQILNAVAGEVGVAPVTDPFGSSNQVFSQLKVLITSAGRELLYYGAACNGWEQLQTEESFTTASTDSGDYDLPDDFGYMIDQTGWERKENLPLFGPLSAQEWQYLLGRDLVSYTIYASFRIQQGKLRLFPQPPPDGLNIAYEYISRNWVRSGTDSLVRSSRVEEGSDIILYEPILMVKLLKAKYLEAKGFDSSAARNDFALMFDSITGTEKSAQILNAAGLHWEYPYLTPWRNLPDTNYGS